MGTKLSVDLLDNYHIALIITILSMSGNGFSSEIEEKGLL